MNLHNARELMDKLHLWVTIADEKLLVIQPSPAKYGSESYGWDQAFGSFVETALGSLPNSRAILKEMAVKVREAGYIPNVTHWLGNALWVEKLFPLAWSIRTAKDPRFSAATQQPLMAQALFYSVEKFGLSQFGEAEVRFVLEQADVATEWFLSKRNRLGHGLTTLLLPIESGEDVLDVWDEYSQGVSPKFLPKSWRIFYASLFLTFRYKKLGWDLDRIFKTRNSWIVEPVSTNVLLARELLSSASLWEKLGQKDKADTRRAQAEKLRSSIDKFLWSEDRRAYFPRRARHEFDSPRDNEQWLLRTLSIECLYPLLLPDLPEKRVQRLVDLIDEKFQAKFTVPVSSLDNSTFSIMRGLDMFPPFVGTIRPIWRKDQVWPNINWFLAESLKYHAERFKESNQSLSEHLRSVADKIRLSSEELVQHSGEYEYYDANDGSGGGEEFFFWIYLQLAKLPMKF